MDSSWRRTFFQSIGVLLLCSFRGICAQTPQIRPHGYAVVNQDFTMECTITRPPSTGTQEVLTWQRLDGMGDAKRVYSARMCIPSITLSGSSPPGLSGGCHIENGEEVYNLTVENVAVELENFIWRCSVGTASSNTTIFVKESTTPLITSKEQTTTSSDNVTYTDEPTSTPLVTNTFIDKTVPHPEPTPSPSSTELQTTSPTELPKTTPGQTDSTSVAPTTPPLSPDKTLKIVFLVVGCVLLLIHICFTVAVKYKGTYKGSSHGCPGWVVLVLFGAGIATAVVAVILIAKSIGDFDASQPVLEVGIAFVAISFVILIPATILLFVLTNSNSGGKNNINKIAMKDRRGDPDHIADSPMSEE